MCVVRLLNAVCRAFEGEEAVGHVKQQKLRVVRGSNGGLSERRAQAQAGKKSKQTHVKGKDMRG